MDLVAQHLISHGIRPSVQRMAIMQYLMEHATHPTVDKIYQDLVTKMPTLSRTTVYNTLSLLEEKNALMAITIDSKNVHYDGNNEPHAHFLCRECGMIYDIPLTQSMMKTLSALTKFKTEQAQLYYKGVCEKCMTETKKLKKKHIN